MRDKCAFCAIGIAIAFVACRDDEGDPYAHLIPIPDGGASDGAQDDATVDGGSNDGAGDAATPPPALLLLGTIVTPDTTFDGQVLVVADKIACAKAGTACAAAASAAKAVTIDTQAIIAPGLVDTHNHILFDVHDNDDWTPSKLYTNHNQWTTEPRYKAMLDTIQCLASETGKPTWCPATYAGAGNLRCELDKWGELKAIVSGTTSVVGLAGTAASCMDSLARSIDTPYNRLGGAESVDQVYTSALFPPGSSADTACTAVTSGKGKAYLIHCGEGLTTDTTASGEFAKLQALTTASPGCFMNTATTVTHGVAFGATEFATMKQDDMKLTWSPQSNVTLYGATADIPAALAAGVTIALGPDWSMGGSVNMLDEMRFADAWDNAHFGDKLAAKDLVVMATKNGAAVTSYGDRIGQIAEGYFADLVVVPKSGTTPYDAILAATPKTVMLTMIGGAMLYGDARILAARSGGPPCETIDVCGVQKTICVAEASSQNKLDQTFAQIKAALDAALKDMDTAGADAGVTYTFSPLAPIAQCH